MSALGNILGRALTIIPPLKFQYRTVTGHLTNSIGNTIPTYSEWIDVVGMVQPGISSAFGSGRNLGEMELKAAGIDFSHEVISVWIRNNILGLKGKTLPAQIKYDDKIYNVKDVANWFVYDGWKRLVCEEDVREEEE